MVGINNQAAPPLDRLQTQKRPRILLVSKYAPDKLYSIENFVAALRAELSAGENVVEVSVPPIIFGKIFRACGGLKKWIGYLDKYLLYLPLLMSQARRADIIHLCDQADAVYAPFLKGKPVIVTCHDLLAQRAALGEGTECYPTYTGRILQRAIICGLCNIPNIVCSSESTRLDVQRIIRKSDDIDVVSVAVGKHFRILSAHELESIPDPLDGTPYVLAIGSSQQRKNRDTILRTFARFCECWTGKLAIVGDPLTAQQFELAQALHITDKLVELPNRSPDEIVALYNRAFALLFPSYTEGFGLPVAEAQACGCPVICTNTTSVPEVAGNAALLCAPDDHCQQANYLIALKNSDLRMRLITSGLSNAKRFQARTMAARYEDIYRRVIEKRCS